MNKSIKKIIALAAITGVVIIGGSVAAGIGLDSIKSYSINLDSNVEDAQIEGEGRYKIGQEITLVANEIDGYEFAGWKLNKKIVYVSTENPYTFTLSKSNFGSYTAVYEKIYDINIANAQNGEIDVDKIKSIRGNDILLTITPNINYELKSLYYVCEGTEEQVAIINNKFQMPSTNVTIHAEFKEIEYSISVYGAEHGRIVSNVIKSSVGSIVRLTVTPDDDYTLDRLYYKITGDEQEYDISGTSFLMPAGDLVIYSTFVKEYDVNKVNDITNGNITLSSGSVGEGQEVVVTVEPDENYGIQYLYYIAEGSDEHVDIIGNKFIMPSNNVTVYATFEIQYNINKASMANGNVNVEGKAAPGRMMIVEVVPNNGYKVDLLYYTLQGDDTHIDIVDNKFEMPSSNITIYATFKEKSHSITIIAEHGIVVADPVEGEEGTVVNLEITPDEGYTVSKVYYIHPSEGKVELYSWDEEDYSFEIIDYDMTIFVEFEN